MFGLGTLINTGAIILGGVLGLVCGKFMKQRYADILKTALGLCVVFIGAAGTLSEMLTITDGKFSTNGTYMTICSLCVGSLVGTLIDLDKYTEKFGNFLKRKFKSEKDPLFTEGFVTASLTVCVGAMAIVGAINDGLTGDYSILLTKGILDFVIVFALSGTYGKGCAFSAIPVFLLQGAFTLAAVSIKDFVTPAVIANISLVGSMLIFCIGLNLMFDKKIKVANMLPSLIVAAVWAIVAG